MIFLLFSIDLQVKMPDTVDPREINKHILLFCQDQPVFSKPVHYWCVGVKGLWLVVAGFQQKYLFYEGDNVNI